MTLCVSIYITAFRTVSKYLLTEYQDKKVSSITIANKKVLTSEVLDRGGELTLTSQFGVSM